MREICKHCGKEIVYERSETVYVHVELLWGSDNILSQYYNNRYWCTPDCITAAEPRGKDGKA